MARMLSNVVSPPAETRRTKYLIAEGLVVMAAEVLDDGPLDWEVKMNLRNFAQLLKEKAAEMTESSAVS